MKLKQNSKSALKPPSLQDKVNQAQKDLANWSMVASSPGLSPRAAAASRQMVRSLSAAVKVGQASLAKFPSEPSETLENKESMNSPPIPSIDSNPPPVVS